MVLSVGYSRAPADSVIPTPLLAGFARIFIGNGGGGRSLFFDSQIISQAKCFLLDLVVVVVLCAQLCGAGSSICDSAAA